MEESQKDVQQRHGHGQDQSTTSCMCAKELVGHHILSNSLSLSLPPSILSYPILPYRTLPYLAVPILPYRTVLSYPTLPYRTYPILSCSILSICIFMYVYLQYNGSRRSRTWVVEESTEARFCKAGPVNFRPDMASAHFEDERAAIAQQSELIIRTQQKP